jgi:hypothetical protein
MAQKEQSLEATIFIQGVLIGAMFTAISKIEPDFKHKLLAQLKTMAREDPAGAEGIARAIALVEEGLLRSRTSN